MHAAAAAMALPGRVGAAAARSVGRADLRAAGVLAAGGLAPVAACADSAAFGMRKAAETRLCTRAGTPAMHCQRRRAMRESRDDAALRDVPNIPLVCVPTEEET